MTDSTTFHLTFCSTDLTRRAIRITSNLVNLSTVPPKYHEFADIFSKTKAETMVFYHLYDLQIKLENGTKPPIRTIYSLNSRIKSTQRVYL